MVDSKITRNSHQSINHGRGPSYYEQSRSSMVIITDVISGIDETSKIKPFLSSYEPNPSSNFSYICVNPRLWTVLTLISIIASVYALLIDFLCLALISARQVFIQDYGILEQLFIWTSYSLMFAFIAASCGKYISQDAEGSGIPEMKSIIGGAIIPKYLSFKTLSSKTIGVITATAAGLSVGREGPFVHITCILADKLCKIPFFKIDNTAAFRKQVLAAAVAVGVSVTFGSPIGGLLFSIEVTSTYYNVSNLWKSLYSATVCCLIFKFIGFDELVNLITSTKRFYASAEIGLQLLPFVLQGFIFGLIGSLFVYTTGKIIYLKKSNPNSWVTNRYFYTLTVCLICAALTFFMPAFQNGDRLMIKYMFMPERISVTIGTGAKWTLAYYSVGKLAMTLLSLTSPIPCGVFTPIFALGAVLGRLYGELSYYVTSVHPGVYSLVGAAALTSSVTHTISVIVIVFELSGQISFLPFMLVGVLSSYAITTLISSSIYDLVITLKKIPYMPSVRNSQIYEKYARDVMTDIKPIKNISSFRQIWKIINQNLKIFEFIPLVDSSSFIIGEISIKNLISFIHNEYLKVRETVQQKEFYDSYFNLMIEVYQSTSVNVNYDQVFKMMNEVVEKKESDDAPITKFWKKKVIIQNALEVELSPFTVGELASISKIHYLFVMLGLIQIYVVQRGQILGVISKDMFLQFIN